MVEILGIWATLLFPLSGGTLLARFAGCMPFTPVTRARFPCRSLHWCQKWDGVCEFTAQNYEGAELSRAQGRAFPFCGCNIAILTMWASDLGSLPCPAICYNISLFNQLEINRSPWFLPCIQYMLLDSVAMGSYFLVLSDHRAEHSRHTNQARLMGAFVSFPWWAAEQRWTGWQQDKLKMIAKTGGILQNGCHDVKGEDSLRSYNNASWLPQ